MRNRLLHSSLLMLALVFVSTPVSAQSQLDLGASATFVNLYNWRGMDFGDAAAIQPSLTLTYGGFAGGFWGSYSRGFEELDTWISYGRQVSKSIKLTGYVTDYYFPDVDIDLFNFNNYDDPDGPGAHTLELGLSLAGPESMPIVVSGFINVYNDGGNCNYLQADYTREINGTTVNLFAGATTGSKDNPGYYGTEDFAFINIGTKLSRSVKISDDYSFPIFTSIIVNPNSERAFLIFGFTI